MAAIRNHPALLSLLEHLCGSGSQGYVSSEYGENARTILNLLQDMQTLGLVKESDSSGSASWRLTELGATCVAVGVRLKNAWSAFVRRAIDKAEMSIWELIDDLRHEGWSHVVAMTRDEVLGAQAEPYVTGLADKIWYTKFGEQSICKQYLFLLWQPGAAFGLQQAICGDVWPQAAALQSQVSALW